MMTSKSRAQKRQLTTETTDGSNKIHIYYGFSHLLLCVDDDENDDDDDSFRVYYCILTHNRPLSVVPQT